MTDRSEYTAPRGQLPSSRIIFVPGMKPKPPAAVHKRELLRALVGGLSYAQPEAAEMLREHSEMFTLISWTHRFYGSYRNIRLDVPGVDRLLENPEPSAADLREIDSMARRVRRLSRLIGDALPLLGRLLARAELRMTLAEVRRYFGDEDGIATEVRGLLKSALRRAWRRGERVLLIGHSLGSVIAYDSLWELQREPSPESRVDLFVTLGSPLATRFIRASLRGADLADAKRYPHNIRRWVNFAAVGEMTALRPVRPYFAPMLDLGLIESIEDHSDLYTHFRGAEGLNVHMAYGYLVQKQVAECIGDWLRARTQRPENAGGRHP